MGEYDTTQDRLAKIEEEVLKYRRGRCRRRIRKHPRATCFTLLVFASLLVCCCSCLIIYDSKDSIPVRALVWTTKYPGAEKVEKSSYRPGSDPLIYRWYIFWTADSVSDVIDHYEKVFPEFEQAGAPAGSADSLVDNYPVTFRSYYDPLDMVILVIDADQPDRWVAYNPHFWVFVPDDAPRTGTLIVIMYYSVALLD
jgi:hypothetical protein